MAATYKNNIELTIFGESHGEAIGIVIGNLPSGIVIDEAMIASEMKRRAPGQNKMSTARKEADQVHIVSGVLDGKTTGAPLTGIIYNSDQHSKDYSLLKSHMRPGHSDYPAFIKYQGFNDVRGGGHFSGRLTAPIVFAGSIAKQILSQKGISIGAHILSIGDIKDEAFAVNVDDELLKQLKDKAFPTINDDVFPLMEEKIMEAKANLDSIGGRVECVALHVPAGIGEPFFDSVESMVSHAVFSIPGVRGIEFGDGFRASAMKGSEHNDPIVSPDGKCSRNGAGGINGGITNGNPLVFRVAFKPTSSIGRQQRTYDFTGGKETGLEIPGRHDVCFALRTPPVVEAMTSIVLADMKLTRF